MFEVGLSNERFFENMKYIAYWKFPLSWFILLSACISDIRPTGISCFRCTVAPVLSAIGETSQICSQFNGSSHFQTYCPKSTLCMKRTIRHKLGNGTVVRTSVERGCASQLDVFQSYNFNQRAWQSREKIVRSAYEEGCFIGEDRGSPGGPPEYCYCQYPLCNSAEKLNGQNHIVELFLLVFSFSIVFTVS